MLGLYLGSIIWLPIVMIITGTILVIVEMFIPGFGIPGTLGAVLLIAGIGMQAHSIGEALLLTLIVLLVLGLALILALHSARHGMISRSPLILKASLRREQGFRTAENLEDYLGREGRTVTVLRPTGSAVFEGVKLDVVSEAEYIPPNARVKIVGVHGRQILVRRIEDGETGV